MEWGSPHRNLDHRQSINAHRKQGRHRTEMQSELISTLRGTRIPVAVFGTTVSGSSAIWRDLHAGQHSHAIFYWWNNFTIVTTNSTRSEITNLMSHTQMT